MNLTRPHRGMDWLAWGAARIGWPGQMGIALVVLAVVVCVSFVRPLETQVAELQARVEHRARQPAPVLLVQDWRASLPTGHVGHAYLGRLFQAAAAHGLELQAGRYRETRDAQSGLTRLSIVLPVTGAYPALRAFLSQALTGQPGLALEGLRLVREDMSTRDMEAELRLVLLVGDKL